MMFGAAPRRRREKRPRRQNGARSTRRMMAQRATMRAHAYARHANMRLCGAKMRGATANSMRTSERAVVPMISRRCLIVTTSAAR